MKFYKPFLIFLIFATTLPFLFLLNNIDTTVLELSPKIFWGNTWRIIGDVVGYIGAILLIWEFIFGARFIVKLFTKDLNWVNKFHQFIGKYGILLIFSHPIFSMLGYFEKIEWIFIPNISTNSELHITLGRIGFILLLIIYFTSALVRGRIKYRPWLYIHYLSYPILGFTYLHALDIGTFIEQYIFLKILWYFFILMFGVFCIIRFLIYAGILTNKFKLQNKEILEDITIYTFKSLGKLPRIYPGQYFYIQSRSFGESHPFTVAEYNQNEKTITFGINNLGKFTNKLNKLNIGDFVNIDGPYGIFTKEGQNEDPKVILAGGIGITPFIELVKQFGNKNTIFLNSNKSLKNVIYREKLKNLNNIKYFEFLSQEKLSDKNIFNEHLNTNNLLKIIKKPNLNKYNYFICGSKRYNEGIKKILNECGVEKDKIFYEDFY